MVFSHVIDPKTRAYVNLAFYLDGISFYHKYNPADQARAPKERVLRRKHEGLAPWMYRCAGSGGGTIKVMVAISFGEGFVICEQCKKNLITSNSKVCREKFLGDV